MTPRSAACTFHATFPYQYPRHKLFKVFETCPVPLHFLSVVFFIPARTGAVARAASEDSRLRAQDLISAEPFLMNEARVNGDR